MTDYVLFGEVKLIVNRPLTSSRHSKCIHSQHLLLLQAQRSRLPLEAWTIRLSLTFPSPPPSANIFLPLALLQIREEMVVEKVPTKVVFLPLFSWIVYLEREHILILKNVNNASS